MILFDIIYHKFNNNPLSSQNSTLLISYKSYSVLLLPTLNVHVYIYYSIIPKLPK